MDFSSSKADDENARAECGGAQQHQRRQPDRVVDDVGAAPLG